MLFAVVVDADLRLLPAHVEERLRVRHRGRRICVRGRGKPGVDEHSRNHVSFGDCAPPSIRSSAVRARAIPRAPRYRSTSRHTVGRPSRPLTAANASRCDTASSRGRCRARSSAVRAGVVTRHAVDRSMTSSSADPFVADDDARLAAVRCVGDQFDRRAGVDPWCHTVQRRGRAAGDDAACGSDHSHAAWAFASIEVSGCLCGNVDVADRSAS